MLQTAALPCYRDTVRAEWVDYNGHLRDAFYMLIFSFATDQLIDQIGLPDAVRKERGRSIYTLEAHINYLHEIKEGTRVRVDMRVLGCDAKRLQLYLEMFADGSDTPVAAGEQMLLHVDTSGPRSVAFDADVAAHVQELAGAHAALPPATYAGRVIGLPAAAQRSRSQHA
ncbi:MAG: Carnitine utilization associated thioesterase [uncultured Paraburkholderia sp.]|uniref:thioesterase family protein n=1 Tax=uncultured Paraburkholderia sp. TaxID=1822466 RepID=UPI002599DCB4|nr:thioesterase family protein [uncultured Paraburkholderia sp.]CAH2895765.1 MAG: Carnitine utilization associated thioesterase [uncultured Paraburkholderia sp.]CAH2931115.1 MAG: Carnitine utilization associated thioesterase [uncultured Paraburkholderia sp.]